MKLDKLAGRGPTAALVSGGALVIALLILILGPAVHHTFDGIAGAMVLVALLAASVWPAAMAVVGLDLEWLEHPGTHTGRMRFSLWAAVVAAFCPPLFALAILLANSSTLPALPLGILAACLASFLFIQNHEARRARLLSGVLPVIGYLAGLGFTVMAIGFLLGFLLPAILAIALVGFFTGTISFVFWAIWLGLLLRTSQKIPAVASGLPA